MSGIQTTQPLLRTPGHDLVSAVRELYEAGRSVDALRRAECFAPLDQWAGGKSCVLAARIAANCGAPRLSLRLGVRAWRAEPKEPEAFAQRAYDLMARRGPLAGWQFLRSWRDEANVPEENQAEILALKAAAAAGLRDFRLAEALLARALEPEPKRPWIALERAHLLLSQDRVEDALEAAQQACALHPHPYYRAGVQMRAHLLQLLDRDDEAIALLREAVAGLQSGLLAAQWHSLVSENSLWGESEAALERYVALSPLLEPRLREWVTSQQCRVAYHTGRRAEAARLAGELKDDFHRAFGERLSGPPAQPERVQIEVTFVRQHFKTCAPATLAAIARFWKMPADHSQLVETMCYDGTPSWEQRDWAERNGWLVREFRVTQESAVALLERGIPFAIGVVHATSAHLMALIGFDRARDTLRFRDPSQPYIGEAPARQFLGRYRAFGPRGMVLVPLAERARLDGLELPDAEIMDRCHQFSLALARYNRHRAAEVLRLIEANRDNHELTWEARLHLAAYDANPYEQARCLDELLKLHPGDPTRLLRRVACMAGASREERIRFLEQACSAENADPSLRVRLAQELAGDARSLPEARRLLRRALRQSPLDPTTIGVAALLSWEEGQLEDATEFYRFAANLDGFQEQRYQAWFAACRRTRRTEEAMAHLRDRFARFGHRSGQPALTLAWAWTEMEQPHQALAVLTEAARLRPDDGCLLLRSASLVAGVGQAAESNRLLDAAKGMVRTTDWLRAAAEIANIRQDTAAELHRAREILEIEPLALDAHGGAAGALARSEGPEAALAHLRSACARFPHHCGLRRMLVEWTREAGPEEVEIAARILLEREPSDDWARRELAVALCRLGRLQEALDEATEAIRIAPLASAGFSILGHIHQQLGQIDEARRHLRRAVELSVDNSGALNALMGLARNDAERKEELALVERELIRQVVEGEGLLAFLEMARPVIGPGDLLDIVRQAHRERPDLWHTWSALVAQLGHTQGFEEALEVAKAACQRFAHLPRAWMDLAKVHQWRKEFAEEITAGERAFEINPAWVPAAIALGNTLEIHGRLQDARRVCERALCHVKTDTHLHACHAHALWRLREQNAAFESLEKAIRLAPDYGWAWEVLVAWARECGEPERPGRLAQALTQERPGDPRVWLTLARVLSGPDSLPERLHAAERALALDKRLTQAWVVKAELLAGAERFDEAIQTCREGEAVCCVGVHILRGQHAWIEACRGQVSEAISLMRKVLADNASYVWGWRQLARWLQDQEAFVDAAAALEQLVRLCPQEAWVHRQLGSLRLGQNNREAAIQSFSRALALEPADTLAAHSLFAQQLAGDDLAGAEATLRQMVTHQPGTATLGARIMLQLRRKDLTSATRELTTLCGMPDPDPWAVNAAAEAFRMAAYSREALAVFRRALKTSNCNTQVGAAAMTLLLASRKAFTAVRLFAQLPPGEIQHRAAAPLVHGLINQGSTLWLRWVLWRTPEAIRSNDEAWGTVGSGLVRTRRMNAAARWLADWRSRSGVEPWMIFNLCVALRCLGRYGEAHDLARHVVEKWAHREGAADFQLFLAVEEALAGSVTAAQEHLQRAKVQENLTYDQDLLVIAQELVRFQQAPPGQRTEQFGVSRRRLSGRFSSWRLLHTFKDVRRTFGRAAGVFVHSGGGWRAKLWFGWKLNWQWTLAPLAPMAVVLGVSTSVVLIGLLVWWAARRADAKSRLLH